MELCKRGNDIASRLKPFIDDLVPQMKKLQVLEVRRSPGPSCKRESTFREFADTLTWTDMDFAEDAKKTLAIAVYKRSQEIEATANELAALKAQETQNK